MVTLATVLCLPLQDGTPKHVLYTSADLMDPALEHVQHARHLIADLETPALPPDDSISRARDPKSGLNEDQEAAVDRWVAQKTEDVPFLVKKCNNTFVLLCMGFAEMLSAPFWLLADVLLLHLALKNSGLLLELTASRQGCSLTGCRACCRVLSTSDYALILGMPGTGKTSTIVQAIKGLVAQGKSALLTSYTNSAVDNVLLKLLQEGVHFLRLGRTESVHPMLQGWIVGGGKYPDTSVKALTHLSQSTQVVRLPIGIMCCWHSLDMTHQACWHSNRIQQQSQENCGKMLTLQLLVTSNNSCMCTCLAICMNLCPSSLLLASMHADWTTGAT